MEGRKKEEEEEREERGLHDEIMKKNGSEYRKASKQAKGEIQHIQKKEEAIAFVSVCLSVCFGVLVLAFQ